MHGNQAQIETWVSNQIADFWAVFNAREYEAVVEDVQSRINQLIEELRQFAFDLWAACKSKEAAMSWIVGFPVDLGCGDPP
jgi:hypothetical protein